jgi:hypothetical protein
MGLGGERSQEVGYMWGVERKSLWNLTIEKEENKPLERILSSKNINIMYNIEKLRVKLLPYLKFTAIKCYA